MVNNSGILSNEEEKMLTFSKTEGKVGHQALLKHTHEKQAANHVIINTLHDVVYRLQREIIAEAKFRDSSIVTTGNYSCGLSHKSNESKRPDYLNF